MEGNAVSSRRRGGRQPDLRVPGAAGFSRADAEAVTQRWENRG
jgi:hypothetical protein